MEELDLKTYQNKCKELHKLIHPSFKLFHPSIIASVCLTIVGEMGKNSSEKNRAFDEAILILNKFKDMK